MTNTVSNTDNADKPTLFELAKQIKSMQIRGAGRIARAAAEALADYADEICKKDSLISIAEFEKEMTDAKNILLATRPTAVSLPNAVNIVLRDLEYYNSPSEAIIAIRDNAAGFIADSNMAVKRIAEMGAKRIKDNSVVMTHCNSDAAISAILEAKRQGKEFEVYATEVRPKNQGHLTIKALSDAGIKTNFIVDSAVRYFMHKVDLVLTGCDAVAVNGAVVNKIGTSQIALCAHEARVPFIVAGETYKFAPRTLMGELIEIEERASSEVTNCEYSNLPNVTVRNPAFDVTPAQYISLIITEKGAIPPEMAYIVIREYLGWDISSFDQR